MLAVHMLGDPDVMVGEESAVMLERTRSGEEELSVGWCEFIAYWLLTDRVDF